MRNQALAALVIHLLDEIDASLGGNDSAEIRITVRHEKEPRRRHSGGWDPGYRITVRSGRVHTFYVGESDLRRDRRGWWLEGGLLEFGRRMFSELPRLSDETLSRLAGVLTDSQQERDA